MNILITNTGGEWVSGFGGDERRFGCDGEQPSNLNFADDIASKVIRPNEEDLTIDMFKVEKEAVWNEKRGHLSSVEKILGEHTNTSKCTYLALRNSDNRIQSDNEQQTICANSNGLVGKKDLSAEKTVTEIQLPDHHIVKDICVDEVVWSVDKKLIENEEEHKTSSGIYYSVGTVKESQSEEMATAIAHDSKTRTVCEPLICVIDKDIEKQPFPESSYGVGDQMNLAEQIVGDKFHEPISSPQLIPPKYRVEEPQKLSQDSFSSSNDHKQSVDARAIDQDLLKCTTVQAVPSDTSKLQECSWMTENPVNGFLKDMIEDHSTIVGVISEMKESSQSGGNVGCLDVISNSMLEEGFNAAVHSGAQTLSQANYAKENPFDGLPGNPSNGFSKDMIADYSTVVGVISETKESSQSSANVGGLDVISNNMLEGCDAAVHYGAQTLSQADYAKENPFDGLPSNPSNGFSKDTIADYSTVVGVTSETKESSQSSGNVRGLDVLSNNMLEEGFNAVVHSGAQTLSQADYAEENPFDGSPSNPSNGFSKDTIADYSTVVGVTSETKESSQSSGNVGGLDVISNNMLEEGFIAAVHYGAQTLSQADYAEENPFDGSPSNPSNGFSKDTIADYSTVVGVTSETKESSQSSGNVGGLDVISSNMLEEGFDAAVHSGAQTLSQADYAKENPFDRLPSNPSIGFTKDMIVNYSTVVGVISETKESSQSSANVGGLDVISNNMLEEGFDAAVLSGTQTLSQADYAQKNPFDGLPSNPSNGFSTDRIADYSTVVGVISETKESSQSSGNVGGLDVISNNMLEEGFDAAVHYGAQTLSQADCAKENSSNGLSSNPFESNSADSKIIASCEIDGLDTCDFNPRAGETVCTNDDEKAIESRQLGPVPNDHFVEGAVTDGETNSARTFVYQNRGDLNLSGPMISSGPTASSGHIYSGNISLRSDSSTTSTRSFAFPILQTEWNSSPVKMEKAKRRHSRKNRGWGWGLLCCKF